MSNKDFEIEIQNKIDEKPRTVQLPANILAFGEIEPDDVKVYIKQDVYKDLEKLANSDTTKELGSIIFGDYCEEHGKTHIIISDYVEAKYTDASAATLTFTHETWDYIHKEHDKRFASKKMVGWQHTHPSYGIFLSNYDMFIQENFFNMPFQIAYVIDPIQNIRGFFQWKNGKVDKLNGYYIYDEVGKPIKISTPKSKLSPEKKKSRATACIIALLLASTIALGATSLHLSNNQNSSTSVASLPTNELLRTTRLFADNSAAIASLQLQFPEGSTTTLADLIAMLESGNLNLPNQESLLKLLKPNKNSENIIFSAYTVNDGETLIEICEKNNIDYASHYKILLALNGLDDADKIFAGQTLLIPIME